MKHSTLTAWLCSLALLVASGPLMARDSIDRIVALVNDDVIVLSTLRDRAISLRQQIAQRGAKIPPDNVLLRQVLERLIVERLQLQLAERTGIKVDDATLNTSIERLARTNGRTVEELRQLVESDGIAFPSFREQMREEITIRRLRTRQIENRVRISEREVKSFLENQGKLATSPDAEYRVAHILVATPEGASPEQVKQAQDKAERLHADILAGADFAQMALENSDAGTALEGGDLGWLKLPQLPTLFVDHITGMNAGDVSDVLQAGGGFHIVKLVELRGVERHVVKQTHVRHILIKTDDVTPAAVAKSKLLFLKERIEGGEDFATLAQAHSQDRASAINGGDMGWTNAGEFVPVFEQTMNALAPNVLSEPFESEFGWHLVEVLDRREQDNTLQYREDKARQLLRERKIDEDTELWLRRLRDESFVELRL